ncbi:MAG TPA: SdpI family protein [Humibacter sp.]|nr:SdpI family protein [Humibacter sp.]
MVIGAVVVAILSIAVIVLIPLCATGRIRRNPFIGLRLPAFFASDEAWMAGHRAAVLPSVCGGVVGLVAAILVVAVQGFGEVWFVIEIAAILAGLIVGAVLGTRAAEGTQR